MARIVVGSYLVRFPLGGYLSWVLQWLLGFECLGHDVYFVERTDGPKTCFDPVAGVMTDDCTYGVATVDAFLRRYDLRDRWCFVDSAGLYHGLSRGRIEGVFRSADLFVDMGTHGAWADEAGHAGLRVLVDGEPGFRQILMERALAAGERLPSYDHYYTVGRNLGTAACSAPTAGRRWRPIFDPVLVDLVAPEPPPDGAPFTTVMSWQAHHPIEFEGRTYGQKDLEFAKFEMLPRRTRAPLEIAVAGKEVPTERLLAHGWRVRDAHAVSRSYEDFLRYIRASFGEFSVCKNVFVAMNSGCFSERSAAYLASGRPVVMQDTGFSAHLPCGRGLFAVRSVEEAAAALDEISRDYERHSRWAREVAAECLDAPRVLAGFLRELGI